MKKSTLKLFKKVQPLNTIFQIHRWRKYCVMFTDSVALKANNSNCGFLS